MMTQTETQDLLNLLPSNCRIILSIVPNLTEDLDFFVKSLHNQGWIVMIRTGPFGEEIVISGKNYSNQG